MSSYANDEHVYRAIKPKQIYNKQNKVRVSSAAFIDPMGLSVEIQNGREDQEVEIHLKQFFKGNIEKTVKIPVKVCEIANIKIYNDNSRNKYHRLLFDKDKPFDENGDNSLTDEQAFELAYACEDLT